MTFISAAVPNNLFYLLSITVSSKYIHSIAIPVNISNPLYQLRKSVSTDLEVEPLDGGVEMAEVVLFDRY